MHTFIADNINYFTIDRSKYGLKMYQDNITLSNCTIHGNNYGLSVYSSGVVEAHSCNFTENTDAMAWHSPDVRVAVMNCEFRKNDYGITGIYSDDIMVARCGFFQTKHAAFQINYSARRQTQVNVQGCLFERNHPSIRMNRAVLNVINIRGNIFRNETLDDALSIVMYEADIRIENNTFVDLPGGAVRVQHLYQRPMRRTTISSNLFRNISGIPVQILNIEYVNVTIEKNLFEKNRPMDKTTGIYARANARLSGRIRLNDFSNNNGRNIIEVSLQRQGNSYTQTLDITSNLFQNNHASQGVVVTNSNMCIIKNNVFSNTRSAYDFLVTFRGDKNVSAQYNWWGAADNDHVTGRIRDQSDDPELGLVLYKPFLTKPEMPCEEVANCSGHGWCVRPNMCECQPGWTGSDCSEASCIELGNCHGRGVCSGPNVCQCDDGWLAPNCAQPTCYERNNCSGHGVCVGPNRYVSARAVYVNNSTSLFCFTPCRDSPNIIVWTNAKKIVRFHSLHIISVSQINLLYSYDQRAI